MKVTTEKENGTIRGQYSFQIDAAKKICIDVENPAYCGALLNGAVGSGKTIVLIHAINIIVAKNPNAKILFLAHAQKSLKQQTLDTFADPASPVKPNFTFGTLDELGRQVTVAIPQDFYGYDRKFNFEYAVVDECHQWLNSKSVAKNIIENFGIKKLILASGTISSFVKHNQTANGKKYAMTVIPGEEVQKRGLYSSLDLDLVKVQDLTNTPNLLRAVFEKAQANHDSIERPVVVCASCKQAAEAKAFLQSMKYNVALATSKNDPKNYEIEKFKIGERTALILVGRGLVGINIPMADLMIDLKCSNNVEVVLQYLARTLRQHPDGRKKSFIRVTTSKNWNQDVMLLHKVLSLNQEDIIQNFTGKNLKASCS